MLPDKDSRVFQLMSELWMSEVKDNKLMDSWCECGNHHFKMLSFLALSELEDMSRILGNIIVTKP